jgi:hypothetical protein
VGGRGEKRRGGQPTCDVKLQGSAAAAAVDDVGSRLEGRQWLLLRAERHVERGRRCEGAQGEGRGRHAQHGC